jgi:hypothetical protein
VEFGMICEKKVEPLLYWKPDDEFLARDFGVISDDYADYSVLGWTPDKTVKIGRDVYNWTSAHTAGVLPYEVRSRDEGVAVVAGSSLYFAEPLTDEKSRFDFSTVASARVESSARKALR